MRWRREVDGDGVAGPHLAAGQHDGHDAGLADEVAVRVAVEHAAIRPGWKRSSCTQGLRRPVTSYDGRGAEGEPAPVGSASSSMPRVVTFSPSSPGATPNP